MVKKETEEKTDEEKVRFQVGEIPKTTEPVVGDTITNQVYDQYEALAYIMNRLDQLERAVTGK